MVPLKGFTVISTENRLAPLPGDLPLELSQTAIIHDTEPLPSNKIWRGTISSGDHGLVDPECVEILHIKLEPWFFEGVSRESAETLLNGQPHGSFIVRTTEDEPNQIKLTVRPEGHICHYKILEKDGKFRLTKNGEACNSVSELINFYKSKPIEGLCPSTLLKCYPSRTNTFSLEEWDIHPSEVFYDLGEESVKITQQSKFVLGSWRDNQKVLIEILKERLTKEDIAQFENNIELHSSLKHDRIVRLLGICWTHEPRIIITEFPNKGDLASYVQNSTVDLKSRWLLLSHICSAMEYLEDLGILHNDLTSENCLVSTDPEEVAKVAGLHNAVRKSDAKSGSRFWNEDPTNKSDVYCFGVIMYEIGTSFKQPFNKQKMTPGSGYCPPFPRQSISDEQQSMIKECWKKKKDERPLFAQLFIKMRSLGLCKNESYYSEIKGYLRESTQEGVEEKERVEYVTTGLDPERRNRPSLPIVETVSGELEGSIGYVETPRSPGPPLPSDTQSAKRQELSSDTTVPIIPRAISESIKPPVDHERLHKSRSGPALFLSPTDFSSEYVQFMARHVIPEEEEKESKLIQELRFQIGQAERDKDELKEELNLAAKENGYIQKILSKKLVECRSLTEEKLDWEEYKDSVKQLPLNFQSKQMSKLYSDHSFEPTFLSFTVTHRGGTYVSAAMNVAISVPRGAIGRNKSVTLSCKYFSGDKEKLGLEASAIVVSSIYELSSSDCITTFEKRVQISLPHGIVLQRLGEKFQMKAIVSQTDTGNPEGLCWDTVPSKFCTFSSKSCIVRVQHFSLLTLIIETVQAGVEFFQRSLQLPDESAANELLSHDRRELNKMYPPEASQPECGIYRTYHVALYGETSTHKEGDDYVQNLFFYCYYGIPKNRKEIREQERDFHNEILGLDVMSGIDIDTYSHIISVKSVASSDQVSFDPQYQV
jgi:serine/threonine protein kinase